MVAEIEKCTGSVSIWAVCYSVGVVQWMREYHVFSIPRVCPLDADTLAMIGN